MKVIINSLSDKKVQYKIYDLNGKKRRLLCKGKFLHNVTQEIEPKNNEIIVRICRSVSPLSFLYVWLMQVIVVIADLYVSRSTLHFLWETKISGIKSGDTIEVIYTNAVPEKGSITEAEKILGQPDALYCTSHPCKKITSFIRKQMWIETLVAGVSAIAIIAAVCLIYFKCIGAY